MNVYSTFQVYFLKLALKDKVTAFGIASYNVELDDAADYCKQGRFSRLGVIKEQLGV